MNAKQIKEKIKIVDFLFNIGYEPERIYNNFYYYKSPDRKDENPSFKVNTSKNLWYDLGTSKGGNIIDLVCNIFNCNVSKAIEIILNQKNTSVSFQLSKNNISETKEIKITKVQTLQNKALFQYLESRRINIDIAKKFVFEAYYIAKNKQYFALAFKNTLNGYELRNKYFKGSVSPKSITNLIGSEKNGGLNIFEGFFDFLTALTYYNLKKPTNDTIILNSTVLLKQAEPFLNNYKRINLYLDNDTAGKETADKIIFLHQNVINRSVEIYPKYKDFNDFFCDKQIIK